MIERTLPRGAAAGILVLIAALALTAGVTAAEIGQQPVPPERGADPVTSGEIGSILAASAVVTSDAPPGDGRLVAVRKTPFLPGADTEERPSSPPPITPLARVLPGGPVITSVSPPIASAGTETVVTITGSGFGTNASRESPADVGFLGWRDVYWASGRTNPAENGNDIVSWTDTEVRVRVPTGISSDGYADSASSGSRGVWIVTDSGQTSNSVPFAVSFGTTRATWASSTAVFRVNDNCPNVPGGGAAIRRAAATWNDALPESFQIDCSGATTSTRAAPDGESIIAWGRENEVTYYLDEVNGSIVEADIILAIPASDDWGWTTGFASGSAFSIESAMLGHLGFCIGVATLYGWDPQGPSDTGKASCAWRWDDGGNMNLVTLHPADRAAADYLYNQGSANPPLLAAAFTTDTVAGAAPLGVGFADASIGSATAWAWDFGDSGGSAERETRHAYRVPGTYTVTLTASAPGYPPDTIRSVNRIRVEAPPVIVLPGMEALPSDTNNDGLYEDVNGNGRADFADVVLYFNQMTWIAANEPVAAFDYNGNSRIDFADVVWLFNNL